MPNHITNIIKFEGDMEQIREMLERIQNEQFGIGTIDFNKIIPMPESLNMEAGSRTGRGLRQYREFLAECLVGGISESDESLYLSKHPEIDPEEWRLGKTALQNIQQYGSATWYDWCIGSWGTKWNAYDYVDDEDYSQNDALLFQTAWAAPHPVIEKLAEMFPGVEFTHEWADEDIGYNCGRYVYREGVRMEEYFPETRVDRVSFAARVMDVKPEDYGLCLNAGGDGYIPFPEDEYDLISLFDAPALFTNERISDADIPQGLFCYHLRERDDGGGFGALEKRVCVNHGGSVITSEEIDFGGRDFLPLDDDTAPLFTGEQISVEQYMNGEFEQEEGIRFE